MSDDAQTLYQNGKGEVVQGPSVLKNLVDVRDSFKTSYNAHYASAAGIDPVEFWTNEPKGILDEDKMGS